MKCDQTDAWRLTDYELTHARIDFLVQFELL